MINAEQLFLDGVTLYNKELFWDAIESFQESIDEGINDQLLDDCYLNIAICYMRLSLFQEAKQFFEKTIEVSSKGDDTINFDKNITGKSSSRALLGLIRVDLADGNLKEAEKKLGRLEGDESSVLIEGIEISFYELASEEIEIVKKNTAGE
tara:strand:- start:1861 stop:2313 length:453 start_codon:yes stop_codon:yes gene_type:complete